jgi:glycosyltransferase involved in cell wall biosynthesis
MLLPCASGGPRLRVLTVVSSSNQLYSGIGRALFAQARWLSRRVEFTFAIDDVIPRNRDLLVAFGREIGARVIVGAGYRHPLGLDTGNRDLPEVLARDDWDVVEALCFANTTTNAELLAHLGDRPLVYTPHDQPLWTVPMSEEQARHVAGVHRRMTERADAVLCDSPHERTQLQALAPRRARVFHLPLGCDFTALEPGPIERTPQLLFVGDLVEPRKRFDRAIAVLTHLCAIRPDVRLLVLGNRSQEMTDHVPGSLRKAVELGGFVTDSELRAAYAQSAGLLLLSDYEAFGLPILEALACGTPAFLSSLDATRSLFASCPGAIFCPEEDAARTAQLIASTLDDWPALHAAMQEDTPRLRATFDWAVVSARKWQLLAAAWHRRRGFRLAAS